MADPSPRLAFAQDRVDADATFRARGTSALAHPPVDSHEMQAALADARDGATALRRYIERTKPIDALDYNEVMAVVEQQKALASADATKVAQADRR
jgi:hypothetical protein